MSKSSLLSRGNHRTGMMRTVSAAMLALPAISMAAVYTNINNVIANSVGATTASSAISINSSGEIQGYYTNASGGSSVRNYYTLAAGAASIQPYPTGLNYFNAAPKSGQVINNGDFGTGNGNYLANSSAVSSSGGFYDATTSVFTPIPLDTTYNGVHAVSNDPNNTSQTNTATTITEYAINSTNYVVGIQGFTTTGSNAALSHGFIYNPSSNTTMDIGGRPELGADPATGYSSLFGISDKNVVVGNASRTPSTTVSSSTSQFRGTPTDAVIGTPDAVGTSYTFSSLQPMITTLASNHGGTYLSSSATDISANGNYIIGTYSDSELVSGTTKTVTRSFELAENGGSPTVADLGTIYTSIPTGSIFSYAIGVNDSGTVIGYGVVSGGTNFHAFIYSNGVTSDLNNFFPTSGVTYTQANGIDNAGDIVGISNVSGGNAINAFEISSVPEPSALSLIGVTAMGILGRKRRRAGL